MEVCNEVSINSIRNLEVKRRNFNEFKCRPIELTFNIADGLKRTNFF